MILDNEEKFQTYLSASKPSPHWIFNRILMVDPTHFRIEYAINPYMKEETGSLRVVDSKKALSQWAALKRTYEELGFSVSVLEAQPTLPDMVFAANQSFPFFLSEKPIVCLSQMRSPFRKPEVSFFYQWYQKQGLQTVSLHGETSFEGNGDAILDRYHSLVWGGTGPRTDKTAYEELSERFHLNIAVLELKSEHYYHLDTCFSILNRSTALYCPEAFSQKDREKILMAFPNSIAVSNNENQSYFGCNAHCPDEKHVILQKGAIRLASELRKQGFELREVETDEFMKAGGSVFCLKMFLP